MPVATIGLFALAVIVIALAFAINSIVGGGNDDNKPSPADVTGTQAALKATQTAKAGGGQQTQPPQTQTNQTPATSQTPGQTRTPGTGTPTTGTPGAGTTTPGAGAATYTVKAGDLCGTIASDNGITLQQLLTANKMTEDDCTRLQIGQVLKLK